MYNYIKNNLIKELDKDLYNNEILTCYEVKNNLPSIMSHSLLCGLFNF